MSLQGKVGLVTGGAQGIGRALVESLLEEGASVCICDFNKETGKAAVEELKGKYGTRVMFAQCDVSNERQLEDSFKATLERYRYLDILVNNAALADENEARWRNVVQVNVVGLIQSTHLGLRYMGKDSGGRGGVIVNFSTDATLNPSPPVPIYSATKAAVNQFSRSVGTDLYFTTSGVKILIIVPGLTRTNMIAGEGPTMSKVVVQEERFIQSFYEFLAPFTPQKPANLGRGLIEVLKKGENGSMWLIANNQPPIRIIV